jgi:hypothetical protein
MVTPLQGYSMFDDRFTRPFRPGYYIAGFQPIEGFQFSNIPSVVFMSHLMLPRTFEL